MRRLLLLALLVLLLSSDVEAAKKKKRKKTVVVPALPEELNEGACPWDRTSKTVEEAEPEEISEFAHELERDGRKPEAIRCYMAAIKANASSAVAWFDLGVAYQDDDTDLALKLYHHGLSLQPKSFHYNQFGVLLRNGERHGEAAHSFRLSARLAPQDADPLFNLGGTHETLDQHAEALYAYRGSLERERKNEARIQNNMGNVLWKMSRGRDALNAYQEAEEADPTFPETHLNLATVYTSLGRLQEAVKPLKRAKRLMPNDEKVIKASEEWEKLHAKEEKQKKEDARRKQLDERDGPMTREERVARFQKVIGQCGMGNKDCMRKLLGQEDAEDGELVRF